MAKHRRRTPSMSRRVVAGVTAVAGAGMLAPGVATAATVTVPNTSVTVEVPGLEHVPGIEFIPGIHAWVPELEEKPAPAEQVLSAIQRARTTPAAGVPAFSSFLDRVESETRDRAEVEAPAAVEPEAPAPEPAPARAPEPEPAVEPAPAPSVGEQIVAAARSKIGSPYAYGAAGPHSFDCSGFTSWAYSQVGKAIPRTSEAQAAAGTPVALSDLQPGDIIAYYGGASHVAIYLGDGMMIDALNADTTVQERPLDYMPVHSAVRF